MIKGFKKKLENSTPTKYNRIRNYITILEEGVNIKEERDKKNIKELKSIADKLISKLKIYYNVNLALYIAMYFSFVSYFFSDMLILSDIAELVSKIISLVGTTIIVIGLFFSNKIMDLYYQDLNLLTSHLISIYSRHQKHKISEIMEKDKNEYESFIKFFKQRYK